MERGKKEVFTLVMQLACMAVLVLAGLFLREHPIASGSLLGTWVLLLVSGAYRDAQRAGPELVAPPLRDRLSARAAKYGVYVAKTKRR